ncbi:NADP-dependent glyceraldehyde-3-phosphate dehydrogenase [Streptobacillus moniliformis]|nr:NADP-dependent glyceraldehyde-3-phosphate dehydrogenase [Streptobacillus moniliformis]
MKVKTMMKAQKNKVAIVRREPVGIVLAISPFNYPINLAASKIIPALISGNTVVFKPASQGVLSGIELVKCFEEAGLPEGVLQIITGKGSEIGDYLNTHKEIDFINFTGSTSVGEKIGIQAKMKPILLELGGKDAAIVLEDANLDKAANDIVSGAFSYSGQRCTAIKRVLVMENVADELVDKIKNKVLNLKVGNPFENVVITPLIDEKSAIFC